MGNGRKSQEKLKPPTNLDVVKRSKDRVTLKWERTDTKEHYKVGYKITTGEGDYTYCEKISEPIYTIEGLESEKEYDFVVIAVNDDGESEKSDIFKTRTTGPPAEVTNLKVVDRAQDCVTLTWNNGSGEDKPTGYKVGYLRDSTCVRYVHVKQPTCKVDCLSPGTSYSFFVIANNENGESDPCEEVDGKTSGSPPRVTDLEVVDTSHDCVTLTWNNGVGEDKPTGYKVGYSRDSECVRYVHVKQQKCIVDCLHPGTNHRFFVIAYNGRGESDPCDEVEGKTLDMKGPPGQVSKLEIENTSDESVTLRWKNSPHEDMSISYKVGYTRKADSDYVRYIHVKQPECEVDCLTPGTCYKFFVIACNEVGESGPCKEVEGKTLELEKPTWFQKHGVTCSIIAVVLFAFILQNIYSGNSGIGSIQPDKIKNMEQRLQDFDVTISTLKQQQMNERGTFNDKIDKFKNEMKTKNDEKLKDLDSAVNEARSNHRSALQKINELEDAKHSIENKYKEVKENFKGEILKIETTFDKKISNLKKFVEEFNHTFSSYKDSLNEFEDSISHKMNETNNALEEKSKQIRQMVEEISIDFVKKLEELKKARREQDEILTAVKRDVDTIKPNTFNKESLTTAFIVVVIFEFILAVWIYIVQSGRSTSSDLSDRPKDMNAREVLERIPHQVALSDFVCIVSFDEARQREHQALVQSALNTMYHIQTIYFVVRRHENLVKLPKCKFFIMCAEFSERHVIIEEPGLGLGDLKRCTYEAIQRYRADMVILYTRDPGSRSLDEKLYNHNIYCVSMQPELIQLRDKGRFLSTYDKLTDVQKRTLQDAISKCVK